MKIITLYLDFLNWLIAKLNDAREDAGYETRATLEGLMEAWKREAKQ